MLGIDGKVFRPSSLNVLQGFGGEGQLKMLEGGMHAQQWKIWTCH